jgi:dGTPase
MSPLATRSSEATRFTPEEPSPWRTPFQRDKDRIIQSKAFRRLAHKTQVFVATSSDHRRSRLTHTLEVSQVARTLARGFALNEDLAEAIALGHDLGHTPFGHATERMLNRYNPGGFSHQEQSVRIVTKLANNGQGLNLTKEVIDGIGKHSKRKGPVFVKGPTSPFTPEGELVRASDLIAYLAHDLEDAVDSELLSDSDIPDELNSVFGLDVFNRVGVMVNDLLAHSQILEDRINFAFSVPMDQAISKLRLFLDKRVYRHPQIVNQLAYGTGCVRYIFIAITDSQELYETLPLRHLAENRFEAVIDFIAGMTDRYAMSYAQNLSNGLPTSKLKAVELEDVPTIVEF